jgi:hypothetical protein
MTATNLTDSIPDNWWIWLNNWLTSNVDIIKIRERFESLMGSESSIEEVEDPKISMTYEEVLENDVYTANLLIRTDEVQWLDNLHTYNEVLWELRRHWHIKFWNIHFTWRILGYEFINFLRFNGYPGWKIIQTDNQWMILTFQYSNPSKKSES